MTRIRSKKPLKSAKPHWYCVAEHFGTVRDLASRGIRLSYVTDRRDMANIWRYLGNPKFRGDYDYLLVSSPQSGETMDIYAVRLPVNPAEKKRRGNIFSSGVDAFSGTVDHIRYGWATNATVKSMQEPDIKAISSHRGLIDDL